MMINVSMQEKNETTRVLDVSIAPEQVKKHFDQAIAKVQKKAMLPGFRKGKVPRNIITQTYMKEIREEVLDKLFPLSYQEALLQTKSTPITQPKIEKLDLDEGKPLTYQVVVEVLPKVKLGNYKGLKLKKNKIEVQAKETGELLENLRQQSALLEPVENRPAEKQDVVTVDFEGRAGEQIVEGTKAENQIMELGTGQTIPDFENNMLGMKLQETKTFPATFPADYGTQDLAGKTIDFTVTLKGLQTKKLPELDDAFAKQMGPFADLEALRQRVRDDLAQEKERQNRILMTDTIMKELSKSTQVKVPDVLVERSLASLLRDFESRLARQKQTWEQIGQTAEEFKRKNRDQVTAELKARLALQEIARGETIEVAETDLNAEVDRLARSAQQRPEVIRNYLDKNQGWDDLRDRLRDEKTLNFIITNAKINEA